ncbi:MAG TPA: F0F1 ATP synthase subunit delta [Humisphaera sp.]|jgi:F-type H+-transporting ATPase subunit delta|nr:F0F1 ATP synthase subunit delta [Humisphaera sp.]
MKTTRKIRRDAQRLFQLCMVDGHVDATRTKDLVWRIGQSRFRSRLPVLAEFRRRLALYTTAHSATVQSAAPLHPDLSAGVQAALSQAYGPQLSISFTHNRELLGGVRIKVGSDVYDGSIQARLNALNESF